MKQAIALLLDSDPVGGPGAALREILESARFGAVAE
jgi:hypothetical protein